MSAAENRGSRSRIALNYYLPELHAAGVVAETVDDAILAENSALDVAIRAKVAYMAYREELHVAGIDEMTPVLAALVFTDIVYEEGVAEDQIPKLDEREEEALSAMLQIDVKQIELACTAFDVIHASRPYLLRRLRIFLGFEEVETGDRVKQAVGAD